MIRFDQPTIAAIRFVDAALQRIATLDPHDPRATKRINAEIACLGTMFTDAPDVVKKQIVSRVTVYPCEASRALARQIIDEEPNDLIVVAAVIGLAQTPDPTAMAELAYLVRNGRTEIIRGVAAFALSGVGDANALLALAHGANDKSPIVRQASQFAEEAIIQRLALQH